MPAPTELELLILGVVAKFGPLTPYAVRRHFALALALAPAEAAAHRAGCHYHLGVVALAVGARDEAAGHFTAAIAILPDHRGAREQLRALGGGG